MSISSSHKHAAYVDTSPRDAHQQPVTPACWYERGTCAFNDTYVRRSGIDRIIPSATSRSYRLPLQYFYVVNVVAAESCAATVYDADILISYIRHIRRQAIVGAPINSRSHRRVGIPSYTRRMRLQLHMNAA
eukprot:51459-Eustigmatos_ZCMA.PRE.2